jgi:hypothetical protein
MMLSRLRCLAVIVPQPQALACDHVEVVHCQGSHMNLMTPEDNGGDLACTIAPHLTAELAAVWGDVVVDDSDETKPLGGAGAPAAPRARPGGEDTTATAACWTCEVWHEEHNLPMWTRPGTLVETTGPGPGGVLRLPLLDECVGGAVLGLNDLAWSLHNQNYSRVESGTIGAPPPPPRTVMVMVQDLMERVSEWSPVALTARVPVIGVHLPSNSLQQGAALDIASSSAPGERGGRGVQAVSSGGRGGGGGGGVGVSSAGTSSLTRGDSAMWAEEAARHLARAPADEEEDARAAAVVIAAAQAGCSGGGGESSSSSSSSSSSTRLIFAAFPGTAAARVAFHAAMHCQLCDIADACSVIILTGGGGGGGGGDTTIGDDDHHGGAVQVEFS